uniref:Uncharacterized protein n=1 Tax=Populus trichocarpa TaxID=3694 RepID=A0A3N7F267_POPTR
MFTLSKRLSLVSPIQTPFFLLFQVFSLNPPIPSQQQQK